MRHAKFVPVLLTALLLAGCTRTLHGVKNDADDFGRWVNGKPSHDERNYGKVPTGYAGQHKERDAIMNPEGGLEAKWKIEKREKIQKIEEHNAAVVNETTTTTTTTTDGAPASYGDLSQQVFFPHGSAKIAPGDKKRLTNFGDSVKTDPNVDLTVVGHASTRVDGTNDPVKKKEINFAIAQKRATAVSKVLKNAGVNPGTIEAVSQGDDVPNPDPGSRDQESADRRVEVYKAEKHD